MASHRSIRPDKHPADAANPACSCSRVFVMILSSGAVLWLGMVTPVQAAEPRAALFDFAPAEVAPGLMTGLEGTLSAAGYAVSRIDAGVLGDPAKLSAGGFDLLVLPQAGVMPVQSVPAVEQYLRAGGDLLALRAPLWRRPLIDVGGKWTTREEYARSLARRSPERVLFSFKPDDIAHWQRSSNHPEVATRHETLAQGPSAGQRALHVVIPNLDGWDTYGQIEVQQPFPAGHTLTVFAARGGPRTTQLVVEWIERDESRWLAVAPILKEWSLIALPPESFKYWPSNPARAGDRFRPENAVRLSIGLAFTHSGQVVGRHEYWVGPFGTAPASPEYARLVAALQPPALDTLSPGYKLFDCTQIASLRAAPGQVILAEGAYPAAKQVRSPQPRPQGGGYRKGRQWRFIPLLEAAGEGGAWHGTPATLLLHFDGPYKGGAWASFGIDEPQWYESREALAAIGRIAARLSEPAFLIDGGTDRFTCFPGESVTPGITAGTLEGKPRPELTTRLTIHDGRSTAPLLDRTSPGLKGPGQPDPAMNAPWTPKEAPTAGLNVVAELLSGGRVIDRVAHELHVWKPSGRHFVTVRDGDFQLDGKLWRAHGVNYMPSSGIGTEDYDYFEHWLGARAYDPTVMDRDLGHVRDLGMNAVSIFIDHRILRDGNLLDLLRRLDALGMKANLSLRPGTPLDFQWARIREIIEHYRLAENDVVFAYDLAWEPMWQGHDHRKPHDRAWEQWIVERYGSIENGEKDWAFALPREPDGRVTNPLPQHIDTDGDWRRMVAAYRRFLDTLLYKKYGEARRLVRGIDPRHLVSFRMTEAGNPTFKVDGWMVYDFPYLAGAVDMLAPEAYGRLGNWERVKPGLFEHAYGRWAAPDKPFIWAEAGVSVWDPTLQAPLPEQQQFQAKFYLDLYRMMIAGSADGVFFWWYPGGFRVGENSDYGIINPDGTDRPVTKIIRDHAAKFLDAPPLPPVNQWFEFDRDAHTDGITGVYNLLSERFWKALASGRAVGLRTAGTDSDSTNCPPLAVGNTPWNGTNPPKFLDAAFDGVYLRSTDGWTRVENGSRIRLKKSQPVVARIELSNPAEAKWVNPKSAGSTPGGVHLVVSGQHRVPIPRDVPRFAAVTLECQLAPAGLTGPTEINLVMDAEGRTPFGERFRMTVEPE